jgi:nucleotide-binding universal stress UspA family protein
MSGSIICGVDDSESAQGAARVARALSSKLGLRLVFVRAVEAGSPHEKISAIADRLARLTDSATGVDSGAGWVVDVGHPADRLLAAADDERASLIVVGSTGPRASLLGSISAEVSRRASCPVVVVPPGAGASAPDGDDDGDTRFAGGIARFGLGSTGGGGATDFAGGIARFNFGSGRD